MYLSPLFKKYSFTPMFVLFNLPYDKNRNRQCNAWLCLCVYIAVPSK